MPPQTERRFDIVLLGATGFTGGLTAEYLARNAPEGLRWALAGRNPDKLAAVRDRLTAIDSSMAALELLEVDVADRRSLDEMVGRTRLVATTVGPFLAYGESLVAACAAAGTDYVDITGEPEFVDRMYLEHHETAATTGARLVHCCGFDSIPHDLGVFHAMGELGRGERLTEPVTVRGVVRTNAAPSGGTFHTLLDTVSRSRQTAATMALRRSAEGRPVGRRSRAVAGRPGRDEVTGYWLLPLPTIDPFVVQRSAAVLDWYGPDFRYSHYAGTRTMRYAAGGAVGVGLLGVAAQVGPLRRRLQERMPAGTGPSEERRSHSWFTVDLIAESAGCTLHTRVSGGDPGYDETAKMLAESAMSLVCDENPKTFGQVTPAVAMGVNLLRRLTEAGIRFEVVSS